MDLGASVIDSVLAKYPTSDAAKALKENFHHFQGLYEATHGNFHYGWGSYMIDGQSYRYTDAMFLKQELLFQAGTSATHVLEVGVYLGHSLLLLLLSNPTLRITCIDNDLTYAPRVIDYLNLQFGHRVTFLFGDALSVLPLLGPSPTYDLVHIDADHNEEAVRQQFMLCKSLALKNAAIMFDDYDAVKGLIDSWIQNGDLVHVATPACAWRNCLTRLS
jgi:hypothetical protein